MPVIYEKPQECLPTPHTQESGWLISSQKDIVAAAEGWMIPYANGQRASSGMPPSATHRPTVFSLTGLVCFILNLFKFTHMFPFQLCITAGTACGPNEVDMDMWPALWPWPLCAWQLAGSISSGAWFSHGRIHSSFSPSCFLADNLCILYLNSPSKQASVFLLPPDRLFQPSHKSVDAVSLWGAEAGPGFPEAMVLAQPRFLLRFKVSAKGPVSSQLAKRSPIRMMINY